MNYIETCLKDVKDFKYFTVYCIVDEIGEDFIILRDYSGRLEVEGKFDLERESKIRIFGHWEDGNLKIDKIIKVEGPSEYLHKKFMDILSKLFKK